MRQDRPTVGLEGHLALLHASERQRRAGVARWVCQGLDVGAKVVHVAHPDESAGGWLKGALRQRGTDVAGAIDRGQLQLMSLHAWAESPTSQADIVEDALTEGFGSVRWSGEYGAAASSPWSGHAHAVCEWVTEELCRTHPVSALCQYPADLPEETLRRVCAMHGEGVREALLNTARIPNGLALSGEVDPSNAKLLRSALAAATAEPGAGFFVVDLSGLEFLDVTAARAMVSGTAAQRGAGGIIRLRAAKPSVKRTIRLLALDRIPGVRLEAR